MKRKNNDRDASYVYPSESTDKKAASKRKGNQKDTSYAYTSESTVKKVASKSSSNHRVASPVIPSIMYKIQNKPYAP